MITPPPSQHPDVYVISLKSATARREGMERQAARLREAGYTGNVVFFEATDAARREHLAFPQYSPFWANVAGTPLTVKFMFPSCVPAAPVDVRSKKGIAACSSWSRTSRCV